MSMSVVPQVLRALHSARFSLSDEKRTQAEIAAALAGAGMDVAREVRLGPGDIVDMMVAGRVAIEVKLRSAGKRQVYKQLARYARHDLVESIVLVTNLSMGLPAVIEGKPAFYVGLGRAWL